MYCIFVIGSITYAQKAKRALQGKRIQSKIIKTDGLKNAGGCAYGIELDCRDIMAAAAELRSLGIDYKYLE